MGSIYQITNKCNGLIYIGQTNNFKRRRKEYKNKAKHEPVGRAKYKIMEEIYKYGFDNFIFNIIEDNVNECDLNEREIYWIETTNARIPTIGYNSKEGGIGGELISESKIKMSESSKTFRHSEEEKIKRSKAILVFHNDKLTYYQSAKKYSDIINKSRSVVTAAIKRGVCLNNSYLFYNDEDLRIAALIDIIAIKSDKNTKGIKALRQYILTYCSLFPNDTSVENIEKLSIR